MVNAPLLSRTHGVTGLVLPILALLLVKTTWEVIGTGFLSDVARGAVWEALGTVLATVVVSFVLFWMHGHQEPVAEKQSSCPTDGLVTKWERDSPSCGTSLSQFNRAIHAAAKQGSVESAERLFQAIVQSGAVPDAVSFNSVIHACAKGREANRAEGWLEEMLSAGISPDVLSYSGVIDACAKAGGRWAAARAGHWLEEMVTRGVRPNEYSFSSVINAHAKAGDARSAVCWLDRMATAGLPGDIYTYGAALDACARARDVELSAQVFARMREEGVRASVQAFTARARPHADIGDFETVERLRQELEGEGLRVNEYFFCAILWAYANARPPQSGRAEHAFRRFAARDAHGACNPAFRNAGSQRAVLKALVACVGQTSANLLKRETGLVDEGHSQLVQRLRGR